MGRNSASYVTHLECSATGECVPARTLQNLSAAGRPLLVRYDLERVRKEFPRSALTDRAPDLWRYRELLPYESTGSVVSLGEAMTPVIALDKLARRWDLSALWVKDEGRLPTGSFKARGLALAVTMAHELGVREMAIPTNGNAGAAMAAYAARAGIRSLCFCPSDTPDANVREMALLGAATYLVDGLIDDCGKLVTQGERERGWFNCSTLKEPYRIEGKKTMGLELAEQLDWQLPDVILYPTGGGTGLIGMWKAFGELEALGWIGPMRPRMIAVQAAGCAPIVRAFESGAVAAARWENARTIAAGIRVPAAIGDALILDAVRASGGIALAVDDDAIETAWHAVAAEEGVLLCPETAATVAAIERARERGAIRRGERVVLFNCAAAQKYPLPAAAQALPRGGAVDFKRL
ncbi:MAG TPA: threonine synthase [Burkholderiaceae bacterium]|nr:threonine synthase [Burkholderiaceae bacterium]